MDAQTDMGTAYPASWWESRSAEQLQELVRGGFMFGDMFDGAQRELERRARESARDLDAAADEVIQHRVEQGNRVAFTAAAISVIAAICALVWVVLIR